MAQDKPTVLYVDDLPMNLKLFEAVFRKDFEVILTESPGEALKILEEREVQVLVSDQRMPGMVGTELLEIVAEKYPDIRRFLLTAFTDVETVIEAVNVGKVHGYIKKPINQEEIRQSINSSLEVYYLRKKNRQILSELEQANAALLNLDGLKSEIIHSIGNEISHPLNRIMGTLHLLKSKIKGDELSEVVNILDQSVLKLEQFSMMARQISLIKSPDFRLSRNKVSLRQIAQFSAIETSEELKEQGIRLNRDHFKDELEIQGDASLLVSCLVSLIRFAREHTENGGEICIGAEKNGEASNFWVEDQGVNYPEPLLNALNAQFSEEDVALNLSMGIGLAVSKMIMEVHGGRLLFVVSPQNKGLLKMVFPHE